MPGSPSSVALNMIIFLVYTSFALMVLALRPPSMPLMFAAMLLGALLEAGAAFCVVWLTLHPDSQSAQDAMFAQQVRQCSMSYMTTRERQG